MSLAKNLAAYSDIAAVFAAVVERGAARITLQSKAQAHRWRSRAYQFRKLHALHHGPSAFGQVHIQTDPNNDRKLVILPELLPPKMDFLDGSHLRPSAADGLRVVLSEPPMRRPRAPVERREDTPSAPPTGDQLEQQALELARELGITFD